MFKKAVVHGLVGGLLRLSTKPFECGPHITRYTMYERLRQAGAAIPREYADGLAISHSAHLFDILDVRVANVATANYPEHNILALPHADESFDIVVSDQVLEHVEGNPERAVDETWRVLRPGGVAVHTTCFMLPKHGSPSDFWRFTPEALALLCRRFSDVSVGGWGNPFVFSFSALGLSRLPIPHARWHPVHWIASYDRPDWAVCTWVVARK